MVNIAFLLTPRFKRATNGPYLFFPFGLLSRGRVLQSTYDQHQLIAKIGVYFGVTNLAVWVVMFLSAKYGYLLFAAFSAIYVVVGHVLVRGYPKTRARLTVHELIRKTAATTKRRQLFTATAVVSIATALIVLFGTLRGDAANAYPVAVLLAALLIPCYLLVWAKTASGQRTLGASEAKGG